MARADNITKQRRIDDFARIMLDGAKLRDLRQFVAENQHDINSPWHLAEGEEPLSDRQLMRYRDWADRAIQSELRLKRKSLFREHYARRENLYAKAATTGDLRTALSVLQDQSELLGLYPTRKTQSTIDLKGKIELDPQSMSTDELSQYVRESRRQLIALGILEGVGGTGEEASGNEKPASVHAVHKAELRDELASPSDMSPP